jgi:hypothetical protein
MLNGSQSSVNIPNSIMACTESCEHSRKESAKLQSSQYHLSFIVFISCLNLGQSHPKHGLAAMCWKNVVLFMSTLSPITTHILAYISIACSTIYLVLLNILQITQNLYKSMDIIQGFQHYSKYTKSSPQLLDIIHSFQHYGKYAKIVGYNSRFSALPQICEKFSPFANIFHGTVFLMKMFLVIKICHDLGKTL